MEEISPSAQFFLGANTPKGFFSRFNYLYEPDKGWRCWILKGGPGTGKSSLMKKIVKSATKKGIKTEIIPCASDPNSLDAVIIPQLKKSIVDGTAPHVIDPAFPGVSDKIINLGDFWDEKILVKSMAEIIEISKRNSALHKKSAAYLRAFGNIYTYTSDIVERSLLSEKLEKLAEKKAKKFFGKKTSEISGEETQRFISSVTPDGYIYYKDNLPKLAKEIYILTDDYGTAGSDILKIFKKRALAAGYNIVSCFSPFDPTNKMQALFIPELDLAFAVLPQKETLNLPFLFKKIPTRKFLDSDILSSNKNILKFNKKISKEFLEESILALNNARKVHDDLEKFYIKSMSYTKIDKLANQLIKEIFG